MVEITAESPSLRYVIRLLIRHPTYSPETITRELGMIPSVTQQVGQARVTPKGAPLEGVYSETRWGWSARFEGRRSFFDDVAQLGHALKTKKSFFIALTSSGGSAEIVVHLPGDANIGWTLSSSDVALLGRLRIDLGVEVFPDMI